MQRIATVLTFWLVLVGTTPSADEPTVEASRQFDLYTTNRFHERLNTVCQKFDLVALYIGPLGQPRQSAGARRRDVLPELDVKWYVIEAERPFRPVLFSIHVSAQQRPDTLATCEV